jgi:hypothetical protein
MTGTTTQYKALPQGVTSDKFSMFDLNAIMNQLDGILHTMDGTATTNHSDIVAVQESIASIQSTIIGHTSSLGTQQTAIDTINTALGIINTALDNINSTHAYTDLIGSATSNAGKIIIDKFYRKNGVYHIVCVIKAGFTGNYTATIDSQYAPSSVINGSASYGSNANDFGKIVALQLTTNGVINIWCPNALIADETVTFVY